MKLDKENMSSSDDLPSDNENKAWCFQLRAREITEDTNQDVVEMV